MSFLAVRNAVGIGLGGIISLFGGRGSEQAQSNLLTESLQPGLSRDGVIAFDVPKESAGFSIRLSNGYVAVGLGQ